MANEVAAKAGAIDLAANYRQIGLRAVLAALSIKPKKREVLPSPESETTIKESAS